MRAIQTLTLLGVFLLLCPGPARAESSLEEKLKKKLASAFLKNAAWELDYEAALRRAREQEKPIFAYFTRSYAP